jgi:hypothetical protein
VKIIQEGETGLALAPERGRVPVVYRYRDITLDSGATVRHVLVGVDEESDEVLVIPSQSTPRIKEAREAAKEEVLEARVPRELEDVLALVADRYGVSPKKFSPALIRYYLHAAAIHPPLARRLDRLSRVPLARGRRSARIRVRCEASLSREVALMAAGFADASQSDLVRGAIVAVKEDVLDNRAKRRVEELEAVAAAV